MGPLVEVVLIEMLEDILGDMLGDMLDVIVA